MSENLTDRARKIIGRAERIARGRGAKAIDTHHLLLALVEQGSGVGADVLGRLGIEPAAVVAAVDRLDPPRPQDVVPRAVGVVRMPLTAQSEAAVDLAGAAAAGLGHEAVGTEHLLLGLLAQGTGAAAAVLRALGVRADGVRQGLLGLDAGGAVRGPREGGAGPSGGPAGRFCP